MPVIAWRTISEVTRVNVIDRANCLQVRQQCYVSAAESYPPPSSSSSSEPASDNINSGTTAEQTDTASAASDQQPVSDNSVVVYTAQPKV